MMSSGLHWYLFADVVVYSYILVIAKRTTYKGDDPDDCAKRLIGFVVNSNEADIVAYEKR